MVQISHTHKFIFLANPQCGSTSIQKMLRPFSDFSDSDNNLLPPHSNAQMAKNFLEEAGLDWNKYIKFTTIRNPWSRMVGRYHYGLSNPRSMWHKFAVQSSDFKDFLNNQRVVNASKNLDINSFTCDENGESLVDHILKIEDVSTEISKVLAKVGIHFVYLPRLNSSSHRHYSHYYDDQKSIEKVEEILKPDIEYGQYVFVRK